MTSKRFKKKNRSMGMKTYARRDTVAMQLPPLAQEGVDFPKIITTPLPPLAQDEAEFPKKVTTVTTLPLPSLAQ
jgi:hypothetical protein